MQKRDVIEAMRTTTVSIIPLVIPTFARSNNSVSDIPPGHYIQTTTAPDKDQKSSAVIANIYCGQLSNAHDTAAGTVLFNLVNSAYFSQLRTVEYLGYSVGAENISFGVGRSILSFSVESESNPVYATMRIDRFINEFRQDLVNYDERKLTSQIETQISACQGVPWSVLKKNTGGFWPRAKHAVFNFIATNEKIRALRRLNRDDLVAYWDKYINPKTAAARNYTRIDCQVWSFRILQPTAEQLCRYKSGIIALYGCLNQNGIYGISMSNLETTIAHASANDNVDSLVAKLAQTIKHNADAEQLARVVSSDQNSRVESALSMAIDEQKGAAAFAHLSAENKLLAASIGVQQTPNGAWLMRNIEKFKSVQAVLQPKHIALQVSCYCKEFCK
ncbi:metalloprotease [Kickxella alabastrina]|nr:metalloprotease [Kickxella alabastrina]